ncbi:MAG: hypothetical protein WC313_04535 [Candidatus Kapaibacterium sp.]
MKLKVLLFLVTVCLSCLGTLQAQKDEVNKNLRLVAYGKIDEVRAVIPDLLAKYPNDPGVKLLHGTILDDAFLALDVYNTIITNFPNSEWADHAYWRIVQFYAVLGDTAKAQAELANFRSRYPASVFIGPAADVVRSSITLAKRNMKNIIPSLNKQNNKTIPVQTTKEPEINKVADNNVENKALRTDKSIINPDELAANVDLGENKANKPAETTIAEVEIGKLNVPKQESSVSSDANQVPRTADLNEIPVKHEKTIAEKSDEPVFYGLQVGIYKDKNTAEAEKNKFLVRRLRTQVIEKEVNDSIMFAVVIGHYSSLESAEEGKKIVTIQCGCEPIIYKK